ncbi:hypothetical protein F441_00679 [Phytophthora nicotianae CJ01A1]|uniref:Uncharacterized protein n=1 Tax=Phytophthora nicotianae CJ01A1 TaxID=1317063 RepID=W2XV30_PHYNI|nr:hypothetical protein F441_00679 [Phytophthora nicotianae CJ01A1]
MMRANLLSMNTTSRCSIAFLLSDASVPLANVVSVVSRPSPRVFDETRRRTVEDLPVSSQLSKYGATRNASPGLARQHRDSCLPL